MDDVLRTFTVQAVWVGVRVAAALLVMVAFWVASAIVKRVTMRLADRAEPGRADVIGLLGQAAKITVLVLGFVTALGTVGLNVAALVAGLGLTGFALGFALRDMLSNVLAGVLILFHRPFRRQDRIAVTGYEGVVTAIDLRYTTLETPDRLFLIPNAILFTNPITLQRR